MLFSGTDNHIAGLGRMMEHMQALAEIFKDKRQFQILERHSETNTHFTLILAIMYATTAVTIPALAAIPSFTQDLEKRDCF
jgi:hypothetical protein